MEFYSEMDVFITKATENSVALFEVVRQIARNLNDLDDDEIFANLLRQDGKGKRSFIPCLRGV
jgi:hypothetical protein